MLLLLTKHGHIAQIALCYCFLLLALKIFFSLVGPLHPDPATITYGPRRPPALALPDLLTSLVLHPGAAGVKLDEGQPGLLLLLRAHHGGLVRRRAVLVDLVSLPDSGDCAALGPVGRAKDP